MGKDIRINKTKTKTSLNIFSNKGVLFKHHERVYRQITVLHLYKFHAKVRLISTSWYLEQNNTFTVQHQFTVQQSSLSFTRKYCPWYKRLTCAFTCIIVAFSRRRSEHTDRNVELTNGSFQNHPNSFEIVITWCYRKPFHTVKYG